MFFCQKYIITFWNDHFTKRLIEREGKKDCVFLVVVDFVGSLSNISHVPIRITRVKHAKIDDNKKIYRKIPNPIMHQYCRRHHCVYIYKFYFFLASCLVK